MRYEDLLELAYKRTTLDADVLTGLNYDQLRELLRMPPKDLNAPPKPPKPRAIKPKVYAPKVDLLDYVESKSGKLIRRETYTDGSIYYAKCGERVQFEGRTVSASIVLHWLRTGEHVSRVPRAVKPFRAVVRDGSKVIHIGRFATEHEKNAALLTYKLTRVNP